MHFRSGIETPFLNRWPSIIVNLVAFLIIFYDSLSSSGVIPLSI
jgi:hypothetical protein